MKAIWKFKLEITGRQIVRMPRKPQILTAQMQSGALCLWAIVDERDPYEDIEIEIHGTGHGLPPMQYRQYIATAQPTPGGLVWHVFRVLDPLDF